MDTTIKKEPSAIDSEVEAMRKRLFEMEQEAARFKEMQEAANKEPAGAGITGSQCLTQTLSPKRKLTDAQST